MTIERAKTLRSGDWLVDSQSGKRWKVNGRPKVWKRAPMRVQVPIKHGLYTYHYLTEVNCHWFNLEYDAPEEQPTSRPTIFGGGVRG